VTLTLREIVMACISAAERESPDNEWWGVKIAKKHLVALLEVAQERDRYEGTLRLIARSYEDVPYEFGETIPGTSTPTNRARAREILKMPV
jgi:hypothetical protein